MLTNVVRSVFPSVANHPPAGCLPTSPVPCGVQPPVVQILGRLQVPLPDRATLANLARANSSLGRHLASSIRTGRYCSYTPDPRTPVAWAL